MRNIKYKVIGNEIEYMESSLPDFLSEFHFMYLAKLVPPFSVVKDLCENDPSEWGAGSRIEWDKFSVSEEEYDDLISVLSEKLALNISTVPAEIDSAYKWSLWQYQASHGVPYEKHKELADKENEYRALLKEAIKIGNKESQMLYHLKSVQAADELAEFINPYLLG